ncbi:M1 family metallopeptidase [Paenibacillus eucommiae]
MKTMLMQRSVQWILVLLTITFTMSFFQSLLPQRDNLTAPVFLEEPYAPVQDMQPDYTPVTPTHEVFSNRIVEYHMNVEYLPDSKELKGEQIITWKNPGTQPVQELYLHMYPNAFASKKTTFMQESDGKLRQDKATAGSFGGMELLSIKSLDDDDLSQRISYVQPDDGNKEDRTLIKLSLPQPVNPSHKITIKTQFIVKLPEVFARMGYVGDFVMAGQWFPKVAVYEPTGTRGRAAEGWNLHQYHGNSEFYADFGIFDVKIKVPSSYIVAATGFPIKPPSDNGKDKTYHFYADDVHDFAWSASPNFIYVEEPYSTANIPGVKIKLYLDPQHKELKSRYMYAAKKALARYSQWYGSYPYSTLSIVVPPEGGNGAGGMEYPTLITSWGAGDETPDLELERVIVHEIGHQFWYGMVASNEFEEAWLDEGFTSYAEDKVMESVFGVLPNLPVEASYITSPNALQLNAWHYKNHGEYADNVYTRAKLVLKDIERQVGPEQMNRVMRTYFQRWKFKHPTTKDFQNTLEEVTKKKWDEFFTQYVYGKMMVDFSVDVIRTKQVVLNGTKQYESTVFISRRGGTSTTVPIHFRFADGTMLDKSWDGVEASIEYKLTHTVPLDWVKIDPAYTLVLENKHINNYMRTTVDPKWKVRLNLGSVELLKSLIGWVAW